MFQYLFCRHVPAMSKHTLHEAVSSPTASRKSVYTSALIKHSRNTRERSVSPSMAPVPTIRYQSLWIDTVNIPIDQHFIPWFRDESQHWVDKVAIYFRSNQSNNEFFKGRVKSVYEKEPMFKDFLRNLSLTEQNSYEHQNLSTLKKRFHKIVQDKHGTDLSNKKYDPYMPSAVNRRLFKWF